jgi:transcriptional regulator with XRE-family HTH domain
MATLIGQKLRIIRLERGEVLKDMADKLNISSAYLSAMENGKREFNKNLLEQIGELYCLSYEQIDDLYDSYYKSIHQIQINIENQPSPKADLGLVFARKFNDLDDTQIDKILKVLKTKSRRTND